MGNEWSWVVSTPPPLSWTLVERLLTLWEEIPLGVTVVGGDWNDVMDPGRDRWRQGGLPASDRPTKLSALVEGLGLLDAWRALPGPGQHYTYFSATHASFSHLDYIFVPRGLLNRMRDVEILPRGVSDHSPVALIVQLGPERPPFRWRLSTWNFQDEQYREHIDLALDQFLRLNIGSVNTAEPLWEAMKATIRGVDISYCAAARRTRKDLLLKSEARLLELERAGREDRGELACRQLGLARQAHADLLLEETRLAWLATRSRIYQWGDKSSKLLHRLSGCYVPPHTASHNRSGG